MPIPSKRKILVSGASVAGPTVAYWLHRYGFDVTVVEHAAAIRLGGYPVDVRGTAVDVVEQMGFLPQLADAHISCRKISFVDDVGNVIAAISPESLTGGCVGRDLEFPRGALASLLYKLTLELGIKYRFADAIADMSNGLACIDVTLSSGEVTTYDAVIAADGIHSSTRRMIFGPDKSFWRYLGRCFAGFTVANEWGLSHESVTYAASSLDMGAVLTCVGDSDKVHAFLNVATAKPPDLNYSHQDELRQWMASHLTGGQWMIPRLVDAMMEADDLYADAVIQLNVPRWSAGRLVLAGDAAHAPSFLSGQGTSLALVGAYILAGEIASHSNYNLAFASYERVFRPFVEANQALAEEGGNFLLPKSVEALELRNKALRQMSLSGAVGMGNSRFVHSSLALPDYSRWLVA